MEIVGGKGAVDEVGYLIFPLVCFLNGSLISLFGLSGLYALLLFIGSLDYYVTIRLDYFGLSPYSAPFSVDGTFGLSEFSEADDYSVITWSLVFSFFLSKFSFLRSRTIFPGETAFGESTSFTCVQL